MTTRSCIVCRNKQEKKDLLRLVKYDNNILFDFSQKIPQRSFYVCYDEKCLNSLVHKKYNKLLGTNFDLELNLSRLKAYFINNIKQMVNISFVREKVIIGVDSVITYSKKAIILLASDITMRSENKLLKNDKTFLKLPIDRFELGSWVRKTEVVATGITSLDSNYKDIIFHYQKVFSWEN